MSARQRKYKGAIRIGKITDTRADDVIRISIREDEHSGVHLFEFDMSPEQFAQSLMGSCGSGTVLLGMVDLIGKVHEHKTIDVPDVSDRLTAAQVAEVRAAGGAHSADGRKLIVDLALKDFEVDGWTARRADFGNGHRFNHDADGRGVYAVTFHRYVDAPEDEEVQP